VGQYVLDISIKHALKEVLLALEIEGRETGLRINEKKIKYRKIPSI
jgi:hypothetical protein